MSAGVGPEPTPEPEPVLELESVTKVYGEQPPVPALRASPGQTTAATPKGDTAVGDHPAGCLQKVSEGR